MYKFALLRLWRQPSIPPSVEKSFPGPAPKDANILATPCVIRNPSSETLRVVLVRGSAGAP